MTGGHLLSCHICLEEFAETGDQIPRLLQYTHTLCESCIKRLIKDSKLECPACRSKHESKNEEKSFTQIKKLFTPRSIHGRRQLNQIISNLFIELNELHLLYKSIKLNCNKVINIVK